MEFDKSYREHVLNVLNQVCDFRANLSTKMATLAIDWLRYFSLYIYNTATDDRNLIKRNRKQVLKVFVFTSRSGNKSRLYGTYVHGIRAIRPLV